MFPFFNKYYKRFFLYFGKTSRKIIKSTGLFFVKDFMIKSGLIAHLELNVIDLREPLLIKYSSTEILSNIILRILDGELRLFHQRNKLNNDFYQSCNESEEVPHFTTLRYYLNKNLHTYKNLRKVLENLTLEEIAKKDIKQVTIDIDQTGRVSYGKSKGVHKGYVSGSKNEKCYQLVTWYIRELNLLYKVELHFGEMHCAKDFLYKLKPVVETLTSKGLKVRIICDSGYENIEVFEYLTSKDVEFIFARKQRSEVKQRGKSAKNKKEINENFEETELVIKERKWNQFREIYIQNKIICDELGQYWIKKFEADEFTNVLITNMKESVEDIYSLYKQRANVENIIKELKNEFGFGIAHNKTISFNRAMVCLVGIAFNVKNMFVKYLVETNAMKFKGFPTISTLRNELLHVPGMLVNNGGKKIIKVSEFYLEVFKNLINIFEYKIV